MIGSKSFEIGANEWLSGVTSGAATNDGGFSYETDNVNITAVPGVIYPPAAITDKSTNLTGEIIASCEDPTYLGEDRMFLDDESNFYSWNGTTLTKEDTSSSTFSQLTTDFVAWYDTVNGTNYYATTQAGANGDIVKWNGTSTLDEDWFKTTLSGGDLSAFTSWRPLLVYETNMYVGDKNELHRIAPDLTLSSAILSLNYSDTISALGVDQGTGKMLIATTTGVDYSASRNGQSKIMLYDGYSNKVIRVVPVNGTITAFKSVGNTTYVFYGNKLGYWTGSGIEYLRTLNFSKGSSSLLIGPHRTTSIDNTLYWVDTLPLSSGVNKQIMAFGETIDGTKSFYPVLYPATITTNPITCLAAISSTTLGFSSATDKFFTFDTTSVANTGGNMLYSKRYNFLRDVTFNGAIIEFDQALPAASTNPLSFRVTDDKGNTTTYKYITPGGRSDIYNWEYTWPTIETRSLQFRIGRSTDSYKIGIRRVTVFYTPKE